MTTIRTRKQIQKEETKQLIFQTALALFEEIGYENTTVQQICTACGIAKGTFYLYFKSKEDIIRTSFGNGIDEYLEKEMNQYNLQNPGATIQQQLTQYIRSSFQYCQNVGRKVTTQAFIFNLRQMLLSECNNFTSDTRIISLKHIIDEGTSQKLWKNKYTYVEFKRLICIFITGSMIDWCYANKEYDLLSENEHLIQMFISQL